MAIAVGHPKMDMTNFELRKIGLPPDKILPRPSLRVDLDTAREECESVINLLTEDVSGIGPKAAQRYLLRFEYGFQSKKLTEEFGITAPTISKQTGKVRQRVLKYPRLSRLIGNWRAERANLSSPDTEEGILWTGTLRLHGRDVQAEIEYEHGHSSDPYSWKYGLDSKTELDDWNYHLYIDYLVDLEYGVLLKRSKRAVSHTSWKQEPYFSNEITYRVYSLPHPDFIAYSEGLLQDIEDHVVHDLTAEFDFPRRWEDLKEHAQSESNERRAQDQSAIPEVLLENVKETNSIGPIVNYTQNIRMQDNLESILRVYPLTHPSQIPSETIDLLWNGPLMKAQSDKENAFDSILERCNIYTKDVGGAA